MTDAPRHTTDAAQEFAKAMRFLLSQDPSAHAACYVIFTKFIEPCGKSYPVNLSYAVLNRRADALIAILDSISDRDIDSTVRSTARDAIRGMQEAFSPQSIGRSWGETLSKHLTKEHLISLVFLSPIVSRHYPLPAIHFEELGTLISKFQIAADEIEDDEGLPAWAKFALEGAVGDLIFVLRNFIIFGHDEAVSALVALLGQTAAAVAGQGSSTGSSRGLTNLLVALVLAVDLFTAAPNVAQALVAYGGWMQSVLSTVTPLLPSPPKQLEGPKVPAIDEA